MSIAAPAGPTFKGDIAVDTEADSLHAYPEKLCLLQISIAGVDELLDLVGLDTHLLVAEALYASTHDPRAAPPALVKRMIAAGHLGRKTGQGFFKYAGNAMFGA
jgi:hypothetical protein